MFDSNNIKVCLAEGESELSHCSHSSRSSQHPSPQPTRRTARPMILPMAARHAQTILWLSMSRRTPEFVPTTVASLFQILPASNVRPLQLWTSALGIAPRSFLVARGPMAHNASNATNQFTIAQAATPAHSITWITAGRPTLHYAASALMRI